MAPFSEFKLLFALKCNLNGSQFYREVGYFNNGRMDKWVDGWMGG